MDTYEWSHELMQYKLRTARQKKRLQKEDQEKQLLQLHREYRSLWFSKRNMPMVPIAEPYQRGWKRIFVLREDVKRSEKAALYQQLLDKINTVQYSAEKSFKVKATRRKNGKKVYEDRQQELKDYYTGEWTYYDKVLTDEEKTHFHIEEVMDTRYGKKVYKYVYNEPWRFVLKVLPNIIHAVQELDCELEQELSERKQKIERNHLRPKINRLTNEGRQTWKEYRGDKPKYASPYKNKALHTLMDECNDY